MKAKKRKTAKPRNVGMRLRAIEMADNLDFLAKAYRLMALKGRHFSLFEKPAVRERCIEVSRALQDHWV